MTSKNTLMATVKLSVLAAAARFALLAMPASAQGPVGGAPIFDAPKAGTPDLSGKWINTTPMIALKTSAGAAPPLNAAGKAEYAKHKANMKADPINDCLLHGEPRLLYTKYPFLILQYGKRVDFVHTVNHTFRIANFGDPLDPESDLHWLGNPTAKWEGETLVIDSINFNDKTWLDYSGLPHGMKLTTQERYTLASDGKTIAGKVTITDPEFYTESWTTSFTLKKLPGYALVQTGCMADHKM
jgi:hypothetical protein